MKTRTATITSRTLATVPPEQIRMRTMMDSDMRISGISVFEYISALKYGLFDIDSVYINFYNLMTKYGMPPIVYELITTSRLAHPSVSEELLTKLQSMINSYPVYGADFINRHTNTKVHTLKLSVFMYGPDYDRCTMSYDDYCNIFRVGSHENLINRVFYKIPFARMEYLKHTKECMNRLINHENLCYLTEHQECTQDDTAECRYDIRCINVSCDIYRGGAHVYHVYDNGNFIGNELERIYGFNSRTEIKG